MNIYSLSELKLLAKHGNTLPTDGLTRKDFAVIEKAVNADAYTAEFVITTGEVDRQGDRVMVAGWSFDRYLPGNPVLAWQHDYSIPPIGKALSLTQEADRILAKFLFDAEDPFARKIFAKIQAGYLNAVSVGFIPLAWDWSKEPGREMGWDISAAELLEVSVVGIPANASALVSRSLPEPEVTPLPESTKPALIRQSRLAAECFRLRSHRFTPRSAA